MTPDDLGRMAYLVARRWDWVPGWRRLCWISAAVAVSEVQEVTPANAYGLQNLLLCWDGRLRCDGMRLEAASRFGRHDRVLFHGYDGCDEPRSRKEGMTPLI